MQQALIQTAGLISRLWLAFFFLSHVIEHVSPGALGSFGYGVDTGTVVLDLAAAGFFALVSLWLLLGIYSRIVGTIGMVVCGTANLMFGEPVLHTALTLAIAAMLVLSVTGGGRLRLHAGGWRLRDCL